MPLIYVKSYGCSANTADSEIAKGMLAQEGHTIVPSIDEADVAVIFTCIVKTPTERKIVKSLKAIKNTGIPLVVAGCMPKALNGLVSEITPNACMVGPDDIDMLPEAVIEVLEGRRKIFVDGEHFNRACQPRIRENPLVHITPISSGCLGNCSYCIVKHARGHLYSFPSEEIIEGARQVLTEGCREIWVTAEDTAAYNDGGVRLPELLTRLCDLDGDFRIRVGMMTPNQVIPILDDLLDAYANEKVFKFLHIPIQSGNDEVLQRMNRRYTVQEFLDLATAFRERFPRISISTDIICGFPGETEEQFNDSLDIIRTLRPDVLNISRYWERPGTEAASMSGKLHGRETKERSRKLTILWKELALDVGKRWVGWKGEILLDEHGKGSSKVGRNYAYKPVAIKTDHNLGEFVKVRVTGSGVGFLTGTTI